MSGYHPSYRLLQRIKAADPDAWSEVKENIGGARYGARYGGLEGTYYLETVANDLNGPLVSVMMLAHNERWIVASFAERRSIALDGFLPYGFDTPEIAIAAWRLTK